MSSSAASCSYGSVSNALTLEFALVGLFTLHLVGFLILSWRRRTLRFVPAMVTFTLLIILNLLKALNLGDEALYRTLSTLAWVGLGVSVASWIWRRKVSSA